VKFANDACTSSTTAYNGTCLTSTECENTGGTASGTCAEGFGVCCVLTLSSGSTSSTNNTYLVQASTTTAGTYTYTVCPTNTDVCKLRIDFETFVTTAASTTTGIQGTCGDDTFTVTNPSGKNPPLLCGTLTGQHMYVDASSQCNDLSAVVASSQTTTNREWNIKVTQVECNSKLLPPTGCLQYFTGTTGFMYNYGWQGSTVNGASTTAHLSDQDYTMCIRREEGYCSMSYSATATTGFSVSTSPATVSAIFGDVACTTDYLRIPGLQDSGSTSATAFVAVQGDRICGDNWSVFPAAAGGASTTFVTFMKPFRVGVHFGSGSGPAADAKTNGFALYYAQTKCS